MYRSFWEISIFNCSCEDDVGTHFKYNCPTMDSSLNVESNEHYFKILLGRPQTHCLLSIYLLSYIYIELLTYGKERRHTSGIGDHSSDIRVPQVLRSYIYRSCFWYGQCKRINESGIEEYLFTTIHFRNVTPSEREKSWFSTRATCKILLPIQNKLLS